ncbi:MAG: hypothetical protein ACYTG0_12640 [Planctomycetota bacterium]|jgi:hypothetical protein
MAKLTPWLILGAGLAGVAGWWWWKARGGIAAAPIPRPLAGDPRQLPAGRADPDVEAAPAEIRPAEVSGRSSWMEPGDAAGWRGGTSDPYESQESAAAAAEARHDQTIIDTYYCLTRGGIWCQGL